MDVNNRFAYYDGERFDISKETIESLKLFMINFIKDMQKMNPGYKDCWAWGICELDYNKNSYYDDLAGSYPRFYYGGNEDMPTTKELRGKLFVKLADNSL